ncbi:hypothetical protein HXX76_006154 [Chlamydomonas incerta]|uniref:Uncharacterized protein n=1 Tax=Chlamydomonas incerta TaxID=51695 RepID=A0A835TEW4_CHLIN|nr:hypothetical protein HXX76_006154 [Chlamydomonas incerta]|eukprot:KAG2437505.1 hypothetical protein HXX76_006154 [Chlamydomonas incerta]
MYSLSARALQLLQEHEAEPEDDVAEPRRKRGGRGMAGSNQPKPTTWTWVMTQLMDLMRQYPGGLAEAAIHTELLQRRMRKQGKPDCAAVGGAGDLGVDAPTPATAATAGAAGPPGVATAGGGGAAGRGGAAAADVAVHLPRRISLPALLKVNNKRGGGAAEAQQPGAAEGSPTVVVRVAAVECLAPPAQEWGSGAPHETQGRSWLLHLQEEEGYRREQQQQQQQRQAAAGAGAGAVLCATAAAAAAAAAAAPAAAMHLHSALRLLVMGGTPVIAAGSRVRIGGVPMRRSPGPPDTPYAARLLPSRALVPELPPALVGPAVAGWAAAAAAAAAGADGAATAAAAAAGGGGAAAAGGGAPAWPRFDALVYGGSIRPLDEAVCGALAHVRPGSGQPLQGWLLAKVAAVGLPGLTEAGNYDGRVRRTIRLAPAFAAASPAPGGSGSSSSSSSAAAGSSTTTALVLVGDMVALGDLLLPDELVAVYEPMAVVFQAPAVAAATAASGAAAAAAAPGGSGPQGSAGSEGGAGKRWVEFMATADTIVAVLPPPASPSAQPPAVAAAVAEVTTSLGAAGPEAMDVDPAPPAAAGRVTVAPAPMQVGEGAEAEALTAVAAATALPAHAAGGLACLARRLPLPPPPACAAAVLQAAAAGVRPAAAALQRTALVARVEAILGFSNGFAKGTGGMLRALLADGSGGRAEVALHLARGSKLLSRVWPGHTLVLLGATHTAAPPPHHHQQLQPPPQQQPLLQLRWAEGGPGCELHSLSAMPAATTTPGLVRYTSLEALRRAAVAAAAATAAAGPAAAAGAAVAAEVEEGANAAARGWPAAQLRALAEAAAQLPDPRPGWRQQVPYLTLPYDAACLLGAADVTTITGAGPGRPGAVPAAAVAVAVPGPPGPAEAAGVGGAAAMSAHDGACCSLACVVGIRSVRVATHRVHRSCGRPTSEVELDFGFMEEEGGGGGGGGGGGAIATATAAAAAAAVVAAAAQDTPSKDQRMDGLWHCQLCGQDISAPEMEWAYAPGHLELELELSGRAEDGQQQQLGQGLGQAVAEADAPGAGPGAAWAVLVAADPGALQGLLGVSAAAFHALNSAGRQGAIKNALRDDKGRPRRFVLSVYPVPPAAAAAATAAGATAAVAAHPIGQLQGGHGGLPAPAAAASLDGCWAVAQVRGVDFA